MGLLKRIRWTIWLIVALGIGACLMPPTAAPLTTRFSHAVHLDLERFACKLCHAGAQTTDTPGMPTPQLCRVCHEKLDKGKPPLHTAESFFDANANLRRTRSLELGQEIRFSHASHVALHKLECAECHGDMARTDGLSRPVARKSTCMKCHAERGFQNNCDSCHREITRDTVPPSHDKSWQQDHGRALGFGPTGTADRCELCHDETGNSCRACHQLKAPRDHTHYWRQRGHGVIASVNRSRCATCHHRPDFCSRCHESTRPRSHRGGYGNPSNRHCGSCHLPAQSSSCKLCHKATTAHTLSTPLPSNHSPAMNCRLCHGAGVKLPHPDPGARCTLCHR